MGKNDIGFTAEQIDALLRSGGLKRLGMGSRRACYSLPGGRLCVKCYRSDAEIAEGKNPECRPFRPLSPSVVREIHRFRFNRKRNTCCQEYEYWQKLKRRCPEELMAAFPATLAIVLLPTRGWAVVEELVTNEDGSRIVKFIEAWCSADGAARILLRGLLDSMAEMLVRHSVRMYDPQTIFVQRGADGTPRLRIVDFEPASRALIALDNLALPLVRMKLRRRFGRYRKMLMERPPPSETKDAAAPLRVNVLCMKWGDYYSADYVNRLYAGVRRNLRRPFRFVCVTDDARGLVPGVEAVPFPPDPKVPGVGSQRPWPNIFAKLAIFRNGFADLAGPTLFLDLDVLVTGPLDRFFDYKPGEFCIIHNWVERRKALFRKLLPIGNSSCFRFEAGKSGGVWDVFLREKDIPGQAGRFSLGSQKFQTFAMMETGKVNWWPPDWVCSFKRHLVPLFPLNKIFTPWRPPKGTSIVAFHGQPDLPQALEGYYLKYGKPVKPHLTCRPARWILEYWHE